jgi:predicted DNA-binding transcriptional regulator AlpA
MTDERLRLVDIANYLGVSKQRAHQLTKDPGFPAPTVQTLGERMWGWRMIEAWARRKWWGTRPWRQWPG